MKRVSIILALACVAACERGPEPSDAGHDAFVARDAQRDALVDADTDAARVDASIADAGSIDSTVDAATPSDASVPTDASVPIDAAPAALEEGELSPGGATTTTRVDVSAFVQPAANLSLSGRGDFEAGAQFFQLVWDVAPGRADTDGLGPLFNATSCIECHVRNGRGSTSTVLLRLGVGSDGVDPSYGDQLQPFGIAGVTREGREVRSDTPLDHLLADGTTRSLTLPVYAIEALGYGALPIDATLSPRLAQQLVGQGLLEAIPEADLLALADETDADGDGVSGRARWVVRGGVTQLGRFGWKSGQPTVEWQTAAAFHGDLGITTPLFPSEDCRPGQIACLAAPNGGAPELTRVRLDVTAAFVALLAVPARRDGDSEVVLRGKARFASAGCASCHVPSFVTTDTARVELRAQRIWPYTDLLLHDMGERLSDHRTEDDVTPREWRTPPLWGTGLLEVVNGETRLLHDGRANGVEEAILWHDGEAEASRIAYERLDAAARAELVAFVESL